MDQPAPNLDYASTHADYHHLRRAKTLRRIALGCALAPMAIGIALVLLFWFTDWMGFAIAGLIMLPLGGLTVLTGLIFALLSIAQQKTYAQKTATPMPWRPAIVMMLLLLSNFAVAAGCVKIGFALATRPFVTVGIFNETGAPIDRCAIRAAGSARTAGPLLPGNSVAESFKLLPGTTVRLHIEQAGKTRDSSTVVPPNWGPGGGSIDCRVDPALDIKVHAAHW